MKLDKILMLSTKMQFQKLKRTIYVVLAMLVGMLLFSYSIMVRYSSEYNYHEANKILVEGTDDTGVLINHTGNYDDLCDVTDEIKKMDCVRGMASIGEIQYNSDDIVREYLTSEQYKKISSKKQIGSVHVCGDIDKVQRFELFNGTSPGELEIEDYTFYVYLGYSFRDQELGTIYERELRDGNVMRFVVAGILNEGTMLLPATAYTDFSYTTMSTACSVDECIITYYHNLDQFPVYVSWDEKYEKNDIRRQIETVAEKKDMQVSFAVCDDKYNETETGKKNILNIINQAMQVMLITAAVMILCLQYIDSWQNKRQYGLFYSLGMSRRDINLLIIFRKTQEVFVALILTYFLTIHLLGKMFYVGEKNNAIIANVVNKYVVIRLVGFAMIITLFSVACAVIIIGKLSPRELLEKEE